MYIVLHGRSMKYPSLSKLPLLPRSRAPKEHWRNFTILRLTQDLTCRCTPAQDDACSDLRESDMQSFYAVSLRGSMVHRSKSKPTNYRIPDSL